ncbi:MAG: ABC transporter ATP-binding protein [Lentisphaeria bacterium]|nr:ABC transporter ATP-binding protein [Lentisphaeria bacterium]
MSSKSDDKKILNKGKKNYSWGVYLRLLQYVKPYKGRLLLGILAGFLAGGSLFGGLMMIPMMVKSVDNQVESTAETDKKVKEILSRLDEVKDSKEKEKIVTSALLHVEEKSKLTLEVEKINKKIKKFTPESWNISLTSNKGNVILKISSREISFPAENAAGKMTWQLLAVFAAGFVLLWILRNIFIYLNGFFMHYVGLRVVMDLREKAFSKIMDQSMRFYGNIDVGELISRTTNDTNSMEGAVSSSIADLTKCPLELLACVASAVIACMQYENKELLLILAVGLPACVIPVSILGRKIRKIHRKSMGKIALVVKHMHEVLTSIVVVKAYHAERREKLRFAKVNISYFRMLIKALLVQLWMAPLMEIVAVTSTLVFMVYSYSKGVSITDLAPLLAPCFLAYQPIKSLAKVQAALQKSMAAADRYFQLMDVDTSIREKDTPVILKEFKNEIKFEEVVFSYDSKKILDGISFTLPKGHLVAVVGETGSGKTTIANLIARFYDVNGGRITIDGVDVRDIKISSLRDLIGIVSQEALLFNDTVSYNIAYGQKDATHEEIVQAARLANADKFITDGRHPEGYDTVVGEKGFLLSGGERQRVSIARAILKNPPILILDEATSALDTVTEKLVQEALTKVMANRTVFAIAHRLSTIKNANMILVLSKGKVIEAGTHEELLAKNGAYKKLHDTQYRLDNQ